MSKTIHALTSANDIVATWPENVSGRTFLITAPSPGSLGFAFTTALATAHPATLILLGRNSSKLADLNAAIRAINPEIYVLQVEVDLSSLQSVRSGANMILEDERVKIVDVLVNNAAIMAGPYEMSVDGVELQFATAHMSHPSLGHFLLTALLVPKLRAAADGGRVVNVTSGAFRKLNFSAPEDYDPLFETHVYDEWDAYACAKLANILFTKGLVDRGFTSYSVNPGFIHTAIGARINYDFISAAPAFADVSDFEPITVKTLDQGPNTHLVAALRPDLPNGAYLYDCDVGELNQLAKDGEGNLVARLWEISESICRIRF